MHVGGLGILFLAVLGLFLLHHWLARLACAAWVVLTLTLVISLVIWGDWPLNRLWLHLGALALFLIIGYEARRLRGGPS